MKRTLPNPEFIKVIEDYVKNPKRIIGVFNGGGACGAFEFGAALYLWDIGILQLFNEFVGTSAGGLNALIISKYIGHLEDCKTNIWDKIKKNTDIYERKIDGWAIGWQFLTGGESILDPKGLYKMLNAEFGGLRMHDLPVKVTTTTTDIGCGYVDGGLGNNSPVDIAIKHGATHICLFGSYPDKDPDIMLERTGDFDAKKAAIETSAIPCIFPADSKTNKKLKLIDVAGAVGNTLMALFEEWTWLYAELHPEIKRAEIYPAKTLGESTDYTHVEEWIQAGYDRAVDVMTPEYVRKWLG